MGWLWLHCILMIMSVFLFTANPNARHNADGGHVFVYDETDPSNVGRCLREMIDMCHPLQVQLYCHSLTAKQRADMVKMGHPKVRYNHLRPIGRNTIAKFLPRLAQAAGIVNWKAKTGHCLRQWYITKLSNDTNLNPTDVAKFARHKNVASQQAYVRTTDATLAASFNAVRNPYAAQQAAPHVQEAIDNGSFGNYSGLFQPSAASAYVHQPTNPYPMAKLMQLQAMQQQQQLLRPVAGPNHAQMMQEHFMMLMSLPKQAPTGPVYYPPPMP